MSYDVDIDKYMAIMLPTIDFFQDRMREQYGDSIRLEDWLEYIERLAGVLLSGILNKAGLNEDEKNDICQTFCLNLAMRMKQTNKYTLEDIKGLNDAP